MTEQPNVETQAWREQVERVREGRDPGHPTVFDDDLDALTAQIEAMELERDHWKWDHQEASKELVVRAEAAERALAQIREARAKLARDPEWPDLPKEC